MSEFNKRLLIVIRAEDQAIGNQAASQFEPFPDYGPTFTVGLSPNGQLPITYYWTSVQVTDATATAIVASQGAFVGSTISEYDLEDQPTFPDTVLTNLGLQRVQ